MENIFFYDSKEHVDLWEKNINNSEILGDNNTIMEGYFYKSVINENFFKKKYFVLNEKYLFYKNNKKSKRILGAIKNDWINYNEENHYFFDHKIRIFKNKEHCDFFFFNKDWFYYFNKNYINNSFHEKYEPIKIIGKGSFASIYLVRNKFTNEKLAVKAFGKNYLIKQKNGLPSLKNEIEIMRKLDHKNIIKLYEIHETKNSVYIVIELLHGGNLTKYLNCSNILKDSYNIMKGLLEAIFYLHSKGIMHRDIKPENIVLKEKTLNIKKSYIKLLDFGLASKIKSDNYIYKKCGTPGFIAPEILEMKSNEKLNYNEKCDIFSAGIVLYILLKGKSPFFDFKQETILKLNKECEINFKKFKVKDKNVISLLKNMLEPNPEKRFSAKECLNHEFFNSFEKKINGKKHVSIKLDNINIEQEDNNVFNSLHFKENNDYKKTKTLKKNLKNYSGRSDKSNQSIKNRDSIYKIFANNNIKNNNNENIKTISYSKYNSRNKIEKYSKFKNN